MQGLTGGDEALGSGSTDTGVVPAFLKSLAMVRSNWAQACPSHACSLAAPPGCLQALCGHMLSTGLCMLPAAKLLCKDVSGLLHGQHWGTHPPHVGQRSSLSACVGNVHPP